MIRRTSRRRGLRWLRRALWFIWMCSAANALAWSLVADVNSDSLYLEDVFRDLFRDKLTLATWTMQPASSLFPDAPVYFVLRAISGHAAIAHALYGLCSAATIGLLAVGLAYSCGVARSSAQLGAAVGVGSIALLSCCERFINNVFFPAHHGAALLNTMAAGLLVANGIGASKLSPLRLAGLFGLVLAGAAFDRMVMSWCAAPLMIALFWTVLFGNTNRALAIAHGLTIAAGVVMAAHFEGLVNTLLGLGPPRSISIKEPSWKSITAVLGVFPGPIKSPLFIAGWGSCALLTLLASIAVCGRAIERWGVDAFELERDRRCDAARLFVHASLLTSIVGSVVAAAWSGKFTDEYCLRYLQPLFIFPWLYVSMLTCCVERVRVRWAVRLGALTLAAALFVEQPSVPLQFPEQPKLYPKQTKCLDRLATVAHARFGYADYWRARRNTMLSRRRLRWLAVNSQLNANNHIVNRRRYSMLPSEPEAFLVIATGLDTRSLRKKLGEPEREERCGEEEVWIYHGTPRFTPTL